MTSGHEFDPGILREYDIRGVVGQTLHESDAYALGRSFATYLRKAQSAGMRVGGGQDTGTKPTSEGGRVVVGYDGRLSSAMLESALVEGLMDGGLNVVRIGMGPTPMLYFAEASLEQVIGGIQVTGSHNPANHNGFKLVLEGRPFFGPSLLELGNIALTGDWVEGAGRCEVHDIVDAWIDRIVQGLGCGSGDLLGFAKFSDLRIGWDAGNGAAGPALERLTANLPGEHHLLFTQADGSFPNHHPDPSEDENLADLRALVAAKNLDFGVAFDGDADRMGVIDARGRTVAGDQVLAIFAMDLLLRVPGAQITADIKASAVLEQIVTRAGGKLELWNAGHSHIKSRMERTGSLLGGETTGHIFLAEDYFGFDDGLYAAVALMAACSRLGRSVTQLRDEMPQLHTTPEIRFAVEAARKFAVIDEVRARLVADGDQPVTIDGIRVARPDGWWLLRASNTQEALSLRAESETAEGLGILMAELDSQLALSGIIRPHICD